MFTTTLYPMNFDKKNNLTQSIGCFFDDAELTLIAGTAQGSKSACYRLCVCASGSLIIDKFSSRTLISVSFLHFGQNRGKFSRSVSALNFIRVLLLHSN